MSSVVVSCLSRAVVFVVCCTVVEIVLDFVVRGLEVSGIVVVVRKIHDVTPSQWSRRHQTPSGGVTARTNKCLISQFN